MDWKKDKSGRGIQAGNFYIHRSLDRFTSYRVNPFENYGVFKTGKAAREFCEEKALLQ